MPSTPKSDIEPAVEEPQKKPANNTEKVAENNAEEDKVVQEKTAVFDELGGNSTFTVLTLKLRHDEFLQDEYCLMTCFLCPTDVWTEAKPQKKSKKKARKDN